MPSTVEHAGGRAGRGRRRRAGFTLIEMLISLVLVALLLTAIAAATYASMKSYDQNVEMAAVNQTTRMLVMRIRRDVRTAEAIDYTAEYNQLVIYPPAEEQIDEIRYEYDYATGTLYYDRTIDGQTTRTVLLDQNGPAKIMGFYVTCTTGLDGQGQTCTKRVTVNMYFLAGGRTTSIVCSACPRRNLTY
ncbi:MAG: prepilin-type N-terminal cleavage/methylation domain-containing protein [Planctomycetes bacterium]|nr:prepilin-type N-terminal cleavage/methylation domain-containing protein [Planctomycetota bacterium]